MRRLRRLLVLTGLTAAVAAWRKRKLDANEARARSTDTGPR